MKLVTFLLKNDSKTARIGIAIHVDRLGAEKVVDIEKAWVSTQSAKLVAAPNSMLELIERYDLIRQVLQEIESNPPPQAVHSLSECELLSPIPRPVSVRDGYAFRQHVEAARRNRGVPMIPEFDHFPVIYFSNALAITGPGPVPVQKLAAEKLDFELEAAIVIGKRGKNIPAARADDHIFGYMIMNDWSARHLQMEEMKLNLGPAKGKDFATSLGPYLVTRDELKNRAIPGPNGEKHDLRMTARINGKLLSEGNMKDISWTFAQIVERTSYGVWVEPGEVIGSGTVGTGCLLELNGSKITDNLWLKPGDHVELAIDGLGTLVNEIVEAPETYQS